MRKKARKFFSLLKSDRLLLLAVALGLLDTSLFLHSYWYEISNGVEKFLKISTEDIQRSFSKLNPIEPVRVEVDIRVENGSVYYVERGNTKGDRARGMILTILNEEMFGNLSEHLKDNFSREASNSLLVNIKMLKLDDTEVKIEEVNYSFDPDLDWIEKFKYFIMWFGWGNKLFWEVKLAGTYSHASCISVAFKDGVSGEMNISLPHKMLFYHPPAGYINPSNITVNGSEVHVSFESGYGDKFTFCWAE
ncbi:hypothetical protein DRN62_03915 [Nanoarchaeota archaeon]|nr:MAG: hypothetical protein DRN62_03915 [Nanoarchaeota archaeon]